MYDNKEYQVVQVAHTIGYGTDDLDMNFYEHLVVIGCVLKKIAFFQN
jgi:hypothetical protein